MRSRSRRRPTRRRAAIFLVFLMTCALVLVRQRTAISFLSAGSRAQAAMNTGIISSAHLDLKYCQATQNGLTLLSLTQEQPSGFFPPNGVTIYPPSVVESPKSIGVWLRVAGGTGTRTVPLQSGRRFWQFGKYQLETNIPAPQDMFSIMNDTLLWFQQDRRTPVAANQVPYQVIPCWQQQDQNQRSVVFQILPADWNRHFSLHVQPLSQDGKPSGGAITLICAPAGEDILFSQIPGGYSPDTAQLQIALTTRNALKPSAVWRITHLPLNVTEPFPIPSTKSSSDHKLGGLKVHACAAETADFWAESNLGTRPEAASSPFPLVLNADGHGWTGAHTLQCRIQARALPTEPNTEWELQVRNTQLQWENASPEEFDPFRRSRMRWLPGVIPIHPAAAEAVPFPIPGAGNLDFIYGIVYPGQQHYVQFAVDAIRYRIKTEMLTFHNAKVVYDPTVHRQRVVWTKPETLTTQSGISVTVLNTRPGPIAAGRPVTQTPFSSFPADLQQEFTGIGPPIITELYQPLLIPGRPLRGAEMRLAWRLPSHLTQTSSRLQHPMEPASLDTVGSVWTTAGPSPTRSWIKLSTPGTPALTPTVQMPMGHHPKTPLDELARTGYIPVVLFVTGAQKKPLPGQLSTVTLRVRTRTEVERQHAVFTVPVSSQPFLKPKLITSALTQP